MKNLLYTLLAGFVIISIQSCSEEKLVDEVIDQTEAGGALRNLGETNSLDLRDMSSTYEIILEAQDAQGGDLLSEVRVLVGFIDDDGANSVAQTQYASLPASAFGGTDLTTHNLPVITFSATLQELVSHAGLSSGEYDEGDAFDVDFQQVLTDGRVFDVSNATGDIVRTGRFSYFNAQFGYTPAIDDPSLLKLTDISVADQIVNSSAANTVTLVFDEEFITAPTITRTSAGGNTDDVVGALTQVEGSTYSFSYTPGAAAADTISFTVAGGESTAGVTMASVTLDDAYIVDNVAPVASSISSSTATSGGVYTSITLTVTTSEEIDGEATFAISSGSFDTETITTSGGDDGDTFVLTFVPASGDNAVSASSLSLTVTPSESTDIAGNEFTSAISVSIP